jgi:amidase
LIEDTVNAFIDAGSAVVENAREGPLAGLSLAVKDIFDVKGLKTGAGNPVRAAETPPARSTASAVQLLLNAGARFAGKTQTDEFAFSLMGSNRHFPRPVNSAATNRLTGGSSSGSAAAVPAGLVDIACGSDTAGSIRAPGSFCGLVGLRTTHGLISLEGAFRLAPSFDSFGWFAKDLPTYRLVGDVLLPKHPPTRIGRVFRCLQLDELATDGTEYQRLFGLVEAIAGPSIALHVPFSLSEIANAMRVLQAFEAWEINGHWVSEHAADMNADVVERFRFGSTVSREERDAAAGLRAQFKAYLGHTLADDGILVLPTVPGAAPSLSSTPAELAAFRSAALQLLCWAPLGGFPQLHIPGGVVEGSPWGLSLLGPAGSDRELLEIAEDLGGLPEWRGR